MSADSVDWQRQSKRVNSLMEAAFATDKQEKMQKATEDTEKHAANIEKELKGKRLK